MTTPQDTPNRPTVAPVGEAAALEASGMGEAIMRDGEAVEKEIEGASHQGMGWARKIWGALVGDRSAKA